MATQPNTPPRRITTTRLSAHDVFRAKLAEAQQRQGEITALLEQIADIENDIDNRPLIGGVKLTYAECGLRCTTCYLGCAMLPGILAALENGLAHLGGVPARRLRRDGIGEAGR